MWTAVYMTQNSDSARKMRERMEECEILVMFRTIKTGDNLTGEECFELLVPSAELKDALDIIIAG